MREPLYVGVDVGSSATKGIVIDEQGTLVGHHVISSGFDYAEAADAAIRHALFLAKGIMEDVACCVATGYGRKRVAPADRHVTEITCHARGAREWYPQVRHIIDIGGAERSS